MIEEAFADGAAFVPYLAAGDAGYAGAGVEEAKDRTRAHVEALVDGGADVVELGLPFSEPIADGPTIQQATVRALEAGMTADHFLDLVRSLRGDVPLVVMTYFNVIYRYGGTPGVEAFVSAAADAGIEGMIVPDLPVEESEPLQAACRENDVDLIFIAAPTTREDRLRRILEIGSGFLYVQARLGTTGSQSEVSDHTSDTLARIRSVETDEQRARLPKAVGFGVSRGKHAEEIIAAGADGVIVGSALIDIVAKGETEAGTVPERLKRIAEELKRGAIAGRDDAV